MSGFLAAPTLTPRDGIYRTGCYYNLAEGGDSSQTPLNNTMYATRLPVAKPCTLDRIGIEVTIVGEAGSLLRLGIYRDDATQGNYPGSLLLDAGTVVGDVIGRKEVTISQALAVGLYWVVVCAQSAPTTQPTIKMTSGYSPGAGGLFSDLSNLFSGGFKENTAGTSGALPSTFPATENSTRMHKAYVRIV